MNNTLTVKTSVVLSTYKDLGLQMNALFSSMGLVQTADSGQVVWASLASLPTQGTYRDYEIWRFNDIAQSNSPIYMKVAYDVISGSHSAVVFSFGKGSNGAGTLTNASAVTRTMFYNSSGTQDANVFAASDNSGFVLASTTSGVLYVLVVDRQRDSVGDPLEDGWAVLYKSASATNNVTVFDGLSNDGVLRIHEKVNRWPAVGPVNVDGTTTLINDLGETIMLPTWISNRQGTYNSKMILSYPKLDLPGASDFTVTMFGDSKTYKPLGFTGLTGFDHRASAGYTAAIWWAD